MIAVKGMGNSRESVSAAEGCAFANSRASYIGRPDVRGWKCDAFLEQCISAENEKFRYSTRTANYIF
jgi:hypothetical protein